MTLRRSLCAAILVCSAQAAVGAMTATPPMVTAFPGQTTAVITLDMTFGSATFAGSGTITASGMPAGTSTVPSTITWSWTIGATTARTTFQFAVGAGTLPGTYAVTLNATYNPAAASPTVTPVVNNPSITPSAAPNPVTLLIGGSSQPVTVNTTADPG